MRSLTSERTLHGTPQSSLPDLAIGDDSLESSGALNARGRTCFVLANGAKCAHSCTVKIIEDIRKYAAEQSLTEDEALKKDAQAKSKTFVENGAEVYAKA
jgi:hypothetical protein